MIKQFLHRDNLIEAAAEENKGGFDVSIGSKKYRVVEIAPGKFSAELNGVRNTVCCIIKDNRSYIDIDGLLLELTIPSEDSPTAAGGAGLADVAKDKIFAPMPGKVVKLLVREGEEVKEKQPMVIVEAMKMEHQVHSLAAGTVRKINFTDGDQVDTETPIIELEI
jgi:3-methylcrotonyl-CoA carboxylase alpha subunit